MEKTAGMLDSGLKSRSPNYQKENDSSQYMQRELEK